MREIKFRVWDKCLKEFRTGLIVRVNLLTFNKDLERRYVFQQFTGLKDKNGVEIYEGDIVKHIREIQWSDDYQTGEPSEQNRTITRIGEIGITTRGARLKGTKLEEFEDGERKNIFCKWSGNLTCWSEMSKVIGNIYENPELIGGGE